MTYSKYGSKYRKPSAKKVYRKKRVYKAKPTKTFVKKVQKVINKNAEDKVAYAQANYVGFNSNMTAQSDLSPLIPGVTNGTTDNARIGDQIRATSLNIKGSITMNLNFTAIGTCRIAVRQLIVMPKMFTNWQAAYDNYGTWTSVLLKKGGTTTGFTGVLSDLHSEVNRDAITVYKDRIFYMDTPFFQTAAGAGDVSRTVKFYNYTLKLRNKLLKYDAGINSGLTPTNWCPIMLLGYVHLDGTINPDTVNTQIQDEHVCNLHYQDM